MKNLLLAVVLLWSSSAMAANVTITGDTKYGDIKVSELDEAVALAESGVPEAQVALGVMYHFGNGAEQDFVEAARWYRKAAEQGDANAQNHLGVLYNAGQGVPQSFVEAATWFLHAAEQGDVYAQVNLGAMYSVARGVPQSFIMAHAWFNLAAAHGNDEAIRSRAIVAMQMTQPEIAKAQELATAWMETFNSLAKPQ